MRQVTIGELRRKGSLKKFKEWMPCEIIADGEKVATLVAYSATEGFPDTVDPLPTSDAPEVVDDVAHMPKGQPTSVAQVKPSQTSESPRVAHRMVEPQWKKTQIERSRKRK